jgi:hypothetical protein
MYPGKPCPFVTPNVGCNDYKNRPVEPCVGFQCEWRRNPYFDEWLSPKNSEAIFTRQSAMGLPFLSLVEAGKPLDGKVLTWAIEHARSNNLNLVWKTGEHTCWVGSVEFCSVMEKQHNGQPSL